MTKYGNANAWRYCCKVFDLLSVAALIDGRILCVHGGLSPEVSTIDQIRVIERNKEIPHEGAFCDLVWSDPDEVERWAISPRGAGYLFGATVTKVGPWSMVHGLCFAFFPVWGVGQLSGTAADAPDSHTIFLMCVAFAGI